MAVAGTSGFLLTGKQTVNGTSYSKWMLVAPIGGITALVTVRAPEQNKKYTDQMVRAIACHARGTRERARRGAAEFAAIQGRRPCRISYRRRFAGPCLDAGGPPAGSEQSGKNAAAGNKDAPGQPIDARFLIAALPGGPNEAKDDDNFARVTFDQIGGITDVRIQDAEPLRIEGQPGYETLAKAKDGQGTELWSCNGSASAPAATCK